LSDSGGKKGVTYDEQNSSSANQVTFEALLDDPARGVNIQSGQNLYNNQVNKQCHENAAEALTSSRMRI
jgi:hypothetical protein